MTAGTSCGRRRPVPTARSRWWSASRRGRRRVRRRSTWSAVSPSSSPTSTSRWPRWRPRWTATGPCRCSLRPRPRWRWSRLPGPSSRRSAAGAAAADRPGAPERRVGDDGGVYGSEDALARGGPRAGAALPGGAPRPAETWLRIVQVYDRITRRVDSALHRQHHISLTGFEALRRIAEAPGERATMGELADSLGLSRPGVTSTVNRLVADGLVLRERVGGDRRLLHARLTPAGRQRVQEASQTHDGLIAHLLTLLGGDAAVVTDALARVSASARSRR